MSASLPEAIRFAATGAGIVLAGLILWSAPDKAAAEPKAEPKQKLQRIERALDQAEKRRQALEQEAGALEREISKLRRKSVRIAARAQKFESEITALEQRTEKLVAEESAISASLHRQRIRLSRMLAALQRISRHPPVALIASPTNPVDTFRSAMLLRAAVPQLEIRASSLRRELDTLTMVRQQISVMRTQLASASIGLDAERDRLEELLAGKARLAARRREESRQARDQTARLAEEARDLQDLMTRLAEARRVARLTRPTPPPARLLIPPPPPGPVMPEVRPARPGTKKETAGAGLPVRGRIIRSFGQKDGLGSASKGITIEARRSAQVIAPKGGAVVFAGPFKGFGQLLIIEHARGYHTLLAGLARIDAEVGERVLSGEPVGVLASSSGGRPVLYVELRRRGRPVNPLPWLAAGRTRVNG